MTSETLVEFAQPRLYYSTRLTDRFGNTIFARIQARKHVVTRIEQCSKALRFVHVEGGPAFAAIETGRVRWRASQTRMAGRLDRFARHS
jgi:hypothetical protein